MRILLLVSLIILSLQGLDFEPCFQKNSKAMFTYKGYPAIGVDKHRAIVITVKKPEDDENFTFIRGNRFLKMVLMESKKELDYIHLTPTDKYLKADEVAVITKDGYEIGEVTKREIAFNFATFSKPVPKGSVIGIKCYSTVGIGIGNNKFVETRYVKFFLDTDPFMYGDIGARFTEDIKEPIVYLTDPYRKGVEFLPGDQIIEVNGTKITSSLQLQDIILFSKPGTFMNIKMIRDGKEIEKKIEVYKLLGDSFDNETFLERFGLEFDEHLVVTKIRKGSQAEKKWLKPGDILRQVDDIEVSTPSEVARLLSQSKNINGQFIFERDNFQFFIKLQEKEGNKPLIF